MGTRQVVVEAGQLDLAVDPVVHDLGAHAALAHQQALADQFLDGAAHGGPGQAVPVGEQDLVVQARTGPHLAPLDRLLDLLGHLEVERDGAGPVEVQR